jgi:small-conductance mechanosensitive channel
MLSKTPIHSLLGDLLADAGNPAWLVQAVILLASVAIAWFLNYLIRKRLSQSDISKHFGVGGITRVAFPMIALLGVLVGKAILGDIRSLHLLNIAIPLLVSLAIIRLSVYMLRYVFSPSGWLQTSERFIATVVWIGLALHITGYLPALFRLFDELGFSVGRERVSLLLVLQGMIALVVTMLAALWLGRLIESPIMAAERLDMNLRVVLSKVIRSVLIFIGIMIGMTMAGIDLTLLSVFGGALGVGLGFGLQKIASNYVSGFIILLDRSIHLGDVLTVEERYGQVTRLTARYLVLRGLDGTESIIPNDSLISSTVINHSLTDKLQLVSLPIQVSYESDLEQAMALLVEIARQHPRVIQDPPPKVHIKGFGDNGIDLKINLWIVDPEEGQLSLGSELYLAIWKKFREAGIEIPYPRRDIRILGNRPDQNT